jgi:hypothetical protein
MQLALGLIPPSRVKAYAFDAEAWRPNIEIDFARGGRSPRPQCGRADCLVYDTVMQDPLGRKRELPFGTKSSRSANSHCRERSRTRSALQEALERKGAATVLVRDPYSATGGQRIGAFQVSAAVVNCQHRGVAEVFASASVLYGGSSAVPATVDGVVDGLKTLLQLMCVLARHTAVRSGP